MLRITRDTEHRVAQADDVVGTFAVAQCLGRRDSSADAPVLRGRYFLSSSGHNTPPPAKLPSSNHPRVSQLPSAHRINRTISFKLRRQQPGYSEPDRPQCSPAQLSLV